MNVACIPFLRSKPRKASILAMIGSILYFPVFLTDQTGLFSPPGIPPGILVLEYVTAAVAMAEFYYASMVHGFSTAKEIQT